MDGPGMKTLHDSRTGRAAGATTRGGSGQLLGPAARTRFGQRYGLSPFPVIDCHDDVGWEVLLLTDFTQLE